MRLRLLGVALAALVVCAGCGTGDASLPRKSLQAFLAGLAASDVDRTCGLLAADAVAELAHEFGGASCGVTTHTATRYVMNRAGERAAVQTAVILPTMDIPLSPAPFRSGTTTTRLRLAFHDPVLDQRQDIDVTMELIRGRWRVGRGIEALFTLLAPGGPPAGG